MGSRLIKKIILENGLPLEMFDCSRPVAGDRWQIVFEIRIEVALRPEYFSDTSLSDVAFEDALSLLGDSTVYHYRKERNFIAEQEKKTVLENMETDYLEANLGYFSSPEFPAGLIQGNYQKARSQMLLLEKQENIR